MAEPVYLELYTIYERATDVPEWPFVIRLWRVLPGGVLVGTESAWGARSLDAARGPLIEKGLTRVPRFEQDDSVIVESWF